jgi:hypothetical protein
MSYDAHDLDDPNAPTEARNPRECRLNKKAGISANFSLVFNL